MFRSILALVRTGRMAVFPLTRTGLLLIGWANRRTVALWFRSLRHEVMGGIDVGRLRTLVRGLWVISRDRRTANAEQLQMITVREDGFGIEAREGWIGRATVETLLAPISPQPTKVSVA